MKQHDQNKQDIIRKGLKALYTKGYNATGVQEIANAADIPKGSFYNYFKNKEDFAIEAMRLFTEREIEVMQRTLCDTGMPPLQRIRALYHQKIEFLSTTVAFSIGCFLCNITLEMADVSDAIAREATRCFRDEYAPLLACLQEAQREGAIAPSKNPDQLTSLIRNCWLGALVLMKANKSAAPLQEFQLLLDQILQNAAE
ncbi:TetR/AcrR family transcriptional regulator [Desulfobulbus alkaliphilus]|uniref:TetR/AcrR family transcriptional regulator n=1 Tax=Desulfobulbus alkaliphilus TaxID=869814 RepID=UPI0019639BFA|nr:TetR/AcrR family transcriptional regulator [Desulfobulbus alkaliphilus]MBM9537919.1 TetR family transcriptional regulator C-terminal domain-containing protein [Desulfobulbus alkaliphilus]